MIKEILATKLVPGFHLSTLNLERSVRLILDGLDIVRQEPHHPLPSKHAAKVMPWMAGRDHVENWDEFPNGRYGDARSPGRL